jgi:hypothetical protein
MLKKYETPYHSESILAGLSGGAGVVFLLASAGIA